ncbi:MAG: ArnT family glycosyltransferase [bacterium]
MIQRASEPPGPRPRPLLSRLRGPSLETLGLLGVALALRLAFVFAVHGPDAQPSSDGITYDALAWNIARGMGFSLETEGGFYPTAKAPLLPWLLSLVYQVTGHVHFAALVMQCVLGALVPVLVRALGRSLFGPGVGRIAAWLSVVHPLLVFFSGYLLTESLFTVMLLGGLLASTEWLKSPSGASAFRMGVMWGLATLARPTALPMPFLVALWAWAPLGLMLRPEERRRQVALVGLALALTLAPWAIRNTVVLGEFVLVTTGGGRTLLDANNPRVWDDPVMRGNAMSTAESEPWRTRWQGLSETQVDRYASAEAIAFGLSRWRDWPAMAWAKFARLWRPTALTPGTGRWWAAGSLPDRLLGATDPLLLWSLVTWPLALLGLVVTLRGKRRWFQSLPLLAIGLSTAGALVFWGALRMRVPLEPLVLLYAATGLAHLLWRARARRAGLALIASTRR